MVNVLFDILDHFAHLTLDVTASITSLVVESISAHSALLDSFVILHAALISSMYRLVGVEFGKATLFARCCDQLSLRAAFFVQNVVSSYEYHYNSLFSSTISADGAATDPSGKECSNLMVLLSELYNFQVISCVLIYDIIRSLLSTELTEFIVELLLKLLRSTCRYLELLLWLSCFEIQGSNFDRTIQVRWRILSRLSRVRRREGKSIVYSQSLAFPCWTPSIVREHVSCWRHW